MSKTLCLYFSQFYRSQQVMSTKLQNNNELGWTLCVKEFLSKKGQWLNGWTNHQQNPDLSKLQEERALEVLTNANSCFICTQVQGPYQSTDGDSVLGVWCQTLKSLVSGWLCHPPSGVWHRDCIGSCWGITLGEQDGSVHDWAHQQVETTCNCMVYEWQERYMQGGLMGKRHAIPN